MPARYRLKFLPEALEEWSALDGSIRSILRDALARRLDQPRLPGARLSGPLVDCYKIKLRRQGYRLVYLVEDDILTVLVIAIDKRERSAAYRSALRRLLDA